VISAIIGAIITGLYSLRSRQNEYVNDYYKKVIQRRISAYEQLEYLKQKKKNNFEFHQIQL